jgi:hypothetical protein
MSPRRLAITDSRMFFAVFFCEEQKNIENWVAWFLAELCKAAKDVQEDKRNQRRTELVFSASPFVLTAFISFGRFNIFPIPDQQWLFGWAGFTVGTVACRFYLLAV